MKIVLDTYAWIEFFIGSEKGKKVKDLLIQAHEAYVPDIVLAEIARKYLREEMDEITVEQRLEFITEVARNIPIDETLALLSAKCYLELLEKSRREKLSKPSLADGIILATGRALDAKIVTGDKHFKELKEVVWIGD